MVKIPVLSAREKCEKVRKTAKKYEETENLDQPFKSVQNHSNIVLVKI
jgi:hypothetical protein